MSDERDDQIRFVIYAYDEITWPEGPRGAAVLRSWRSSDEVEEERDG